LEDPPEPLLTFLSTILLAGMPTFGLFLGLIVLVGLLICSALISGAEVAFFSLSRAQLEELASSELRIRKQAIKLLDKPKRLLATILVANNFVNVGIVILSTYLISKNVPADQLNYLVGGIIPVGRIIEVFGITLIVLLFGEIIPKVYANQYSITFAGFMAFPLHYMSLLFSFLSIPLIKMTAIVDRLADGNSQQISVDELSHALELTSSETLKELEDRKILEGIVKFGNTDVKQIMKPRTDIDGIESSSNYDQVMNLFLESGYSRVPVYEETLDKVVGILHIKDLLPYMDENSDFEWKSMMRDPFFVPESKMIDDLLEEFRGRKVHLAMVVDEYGGCEGLVTLEDIIEEIVGDIADEFDVDEVAYSKLDNDNFVFEAKTNLKQFYRILKIEGDSFEKNKGEADTLAGFILEIEGKIPVKNQKIRFENFEFTIESVDKRRIKRVKVTRYPIDELEDVE
jgi:putative hemolysin